MPKIADASIKVCKDWKNISGRKNKRVLAKKYGGSENNWGNIMYFLFVSLFHRLPLRKAIKKFWYLRDSEGLSENEAAAQCWKSYPHVHLVKYSKWTPTKDNATERRGPVPPEFRMTKKPGPKPKLDTKMRAAAKQYLLRDPDLSNTSIAQKLETKRR